MEKHMPPMVSEIVKSAIEKKIIKYSAETEYKPFSEALFSKKDVLLASILQSMYTSFGISVYEQIAEVIGTRTGWTCKRNYTLLGSVNESVTLLIDELCKEDITKTSKAQDIELIRKEIRIGLPHKHLDSTVDIYAVSPTTEMFIDITTVKPNLKEARALRRKLLTWAALRLSQDKDASVETLIAIPYNPYHPKPYSRKFVLSNLHREEILVQEEFWDLLGGEGTFDEILQIFNDVGRAIKVDFSQHLNS